MQKSIGKELVEYQFNWFLISHYYLDNYWFFNFQTINYNVAVLNDRKELNN